MRIAHISDTHFGTELPDVGQALVEALRALAPDCIAVSGDITQRARQKQFDAARAFFDRLPAVPKLLVPGNHDLPLFNPVLRLFAPYRGYRRAFGPTEQHSLVGGLALIGLDTTRRLRHTRGALGESRLHERLSLPGSEATVRCVVVHQPLQTRLRSDDDERLIDFARAAAVLSQLSVDVVLSGHVHMPLLATTRETFPELPRHFILSGAGTAVSRRTRSGAPNSFNLLEVDRGGQRIRLALHAFDAGGEFRPRESLDFRLDGDGWRLAGKDLPENLPEL